MKQYRDLGIVLRRKGFNESDSLINIFSKRYGKLKILAKGSRKIKSKFVGHIEPFSLIKFSAVSGRSFEILTGSQVQESFKDIKSDLDKLGLLNYICEVTDNLSGEKLSNPKIFNLLYAALSSDLWEKNQKFLGLFFLTHFVKNLGFTPYLDNCTQCNNESNDYHFSFYWGGVLCRDCRDNNFSSKITLEATKLFHEILDKNSVYKFIKGENLVLKNINKQEEAFDIISNFLNYLADKKPNSLKFIKESNNLI